VVYQPITHLNQNDVCYVNTDNISIVCDQGVFLQTINSGNGWRKLQLTDDSNLNAIFYADDNIGFIAGDDGRIFKTEDGGNNWTDISIASYFHIKDIFFIDYEYGFAVGSKEVRIDGRTYFLPAILTTTDAGLVWTEKQFNIGGKLNSVSYLNDGILLAVGDSGLVLKSNDYGNTWILESIDIFANLAVVRICPDNITILAGDEGTFLYSYDLGENWQIMDAPYYYNIKGACFNTLGEIVAACSKEVRIDGRTFYMATIISLDPISNIWTEDFSQIRGKYNSVSFCGPSLSIAVGDSGLIAVFDSPTIVNGYEGNLIIDFLLEQNYPNPFNSSCAIKYLIPKSSQVTLKIFNTLGEEIEILVNEEKPVGTYEVNWNAANLPSGVYFYRLQAGDFIQTRKMILLK
jgi:hypothetical protein